MSGRSTSDVDFIVENRGSEFFSQRQHWRARENSSGPGVESGQRVGSDDEYVRTDGCETRMVSVERMKTGRESP